MLNPEIKRLFFFYPPDGPRWPPAAWPQQAVAAASHTGRDYTVRAFAALRCETAGALAAGRVCRTGAGKTVRAGLPPARRDESSTWESWPRPSGIVAGMPSTYWPHAAHAEGGARSESADRQLQGPLRISIWRSRATDAGHDRTALGLLEFSGGGGGKTRLAQPRLSSMTSTALQRTVVNAHLRPASGRPSPRAGVWAPPGVRQGLPHLQTAGASASNGPSRSSQFRSPGSLLKSLCAAAGRPGPAARNRWV
jgi:hypothetical protein